MKLASVNPGHRVLVYCDSQYNSIMSIATGYKVDATLVARPTSSQLPGHLQGYSLLGWKNKEFHPKNAWTYKNALPLYQSWMTGYDYGWWLDDAAEIYPDNTTLPASVKLHDVKPMGMKCSGKYCVDSYNQYAEPNQPDGSFLCYLCRSRPVCMR
jgi:hypothetical protein